MKSFATETWFCILPAQKLKLSALGFNFDSKINFSGRDLRKSFLEDLKLPG